MQGYRMRRAAVVLGVGVLLASLPPAASAQNEPVYAVYDGFHVTDDGLYVLSFAYFSHNFEPVRVPVGPMNRFGPEPADRQQPTTFLPGHQRFQCILVLDPGFEGGLRWTLDHAGVSTVTSDDMLQYNWELELGSVRNTLRDVDPATAPRGVCLNRSPTVRFLGLRNGPEGAPPEVRVAVGVELKLFGSVRDEGLPRSGALVSRWRKVSGPGEVIFSAPDEPRTLATFDRPGVYELELWASDGDREASSRVAVTVEASE
jgi:hypothetical protein